MRWQWRWLMTLDDLQLQVLDFLALSGLIAWIAVIGWAVWRLFAR